MPNCWSAWFPDDKSDAEVQVIEVLCGCGEEMKFSDELEGRRARCPTCRVENTIAINPIRSIRIDGDFEEAVPKRQPWWTSTTKMVMLGLTLGAIGSWLLFGPDFGDTPAPLPSVNWDVPQQVAAEKPSFAYVQNPTPKQIRDWRPFARYVAEYSLEGWFGKDEEVERCEVTELTVNEAPADPRKVSWLWTMQANVKANYKQDGVIKGAEHHYRIDALFQMVPPDKVQFYWNEVSALRSAAKVKRNHFKDVSEWRPDFRKAVREAKVEAKKKRRKPEKDHMIASWFNVSDQELGEILAGPY